MRLNWEKRDRERQKNSLVMKRFGGSSPLISSSALRSVVKGVIVITVNRCPPPL